MSEEPRPEGGDRGIGARGRGRARGAAAGWILLLAGIGLAALAAPGRPDPLGVRAWARMGEVLPRVERELGTRVPGPIRVVAVTRAELGELLHREASDVLRAVEGWALGAGSRPRGVAPPSAHGVPGWVDDGGTIHLCREEIDGAPPDDELWTLLPSLAGSPRERSPGFLDGVLAHERVHVHQVHARNLPAFLRGASDRSDLLARIAVSEGQAEMVAVRVAAPGGYAGAAAAGAEAPGPPVTDVYRHFEIDAIVGRTVFPYRQGRAFVESAVRRLGPAEALRRMFADPPSLLQVEHPDSWPGARPQDAGTGAMLRRIRAWLEVGWTETECEPLPATLFLGLLGPASAEARDAAAGTLLEAQRFEATDDLLRHAVRGHVLAARDEAGARALHDAWIEAARVRDRLVPADPGLRRGRVLESAWTEEAVDGEPVLCAERRYRSMEPLLEHALVLRHGRTVLEVRLVEDPGGLPAVLRLARCLRAALADPADPGDPGAVAWESRWRHALRSDVGVGSLRRLLADPDADVRVAALVNLLRRRALPAGDRDRARGDADPLVRLTALVWSPPKVDPEEGGLRASLADPHPWVAAGGWCAAQARFAGSLVPGDAVAAALRRPEPLVRRAASRLLDDLGHLGDGDLLALMRTGLADTDPGVRAHAAAPLLHIAAETPGLGEVFSRLLGGEDEDLRDDAIVQLGIRDGVPGTAVALLPFLEREEDAERAMQALGRLGAEARDAVPLLRVIADDAAGAGETSRRLRALVALAGITGDRAEAVDAVRGLLCTGTGEEARVAVEVLEDLDAVAEFVPDLAKRLGTADRLLALVILNTLGRANGASGPALAAVESLASGPDPLLAARARAAAEGIRGRRER